MQFFLSFLLFSSVLINSQFLFSQNLSESKNIDYYPNFQNYLNFEVKLVDFENSLYVKYFKTTEFQIENGILYNISSRINVSFGINGGVILGIPYEDRLQAYVTSGNSSGLYIFRKYYDEINFIDQSLAKTRYFIGIRPQLILNISEKWKINAGSELRYYFEPFFEEKILDGTITISDGISFDLLWNLGVNYQIKEHLSFGINYVRSYFYLRRINIGSNIYESYNSSIRYHSLGLNASYSF